MTRSDRHQQERGQALVIMAVGMVALLALAGLVVDGGNAWSQQRFTQNGSDAAAEAGATVLAQKWAGSGVPPTSTGTCPTGTTDPWDLSVCQAVYGTATANGINLAGAYYTDWSGAALTSVGSGSVPNGAQGVESLGTKTFDTYLVGVVGIRQWKVGTQATAVVGVVTGICPDNLPCGALPITIPIAVSTCSGSGSLSPGTDPWPIVGIDQLSTSNEAIVPLCKTQNSQIGGLSAGSVGWLDFGCSGTLTQQILNPCESAINFPLWVQTSAGNPNTQSVEDALNTYDGKIVWFPLFDGTCKVQPAGGSLTDCPAGEQGVGSNTWYHLPNFVGFYLDHAYIAGSNNTECNSPPGQPYVSGNGSNGCLKGWFVYFLPSPGTVQVKPINPKNPGILGVQLIR